ncbi:zinc-dependent metalloprotease [Glaciihabitans arcticus]|uniref:Zinc-dependent metalloprotease n=1 Tax=Glaciihabitans arcticus TaxID=2668039 RepID=A0A4Q9GRN7_9MICO|nr:zinc-dependent metalloprotease [Glaciihabitans arcticus]TBN57311.1 zinc-dependent metalloprotease [Glaciihabitans arcticus]
MPDDPRDDPENEFRDMMREFLSGNAEFDPSQLASAAGLPDDPELVRQLISQLQNALSSSTDGPNWGLALEQASSLAARSSVVSLPAERSQLEQALHVASLWLAETTDISELTVEPRLMSRSEWVAATMPFWQQLAEPVATSIANALSDTIKEQAPEEMSEMIAGASNMVRNVGGTLFAMQLGQVVGQLASEVVSGGDIGIPLLGPLGEADQQAALIPQNVVGFAAGLDVPLDQVQLYLAVRELAHARLFRHAKWLRLQLLTSITDSARGSRINAEALEQIAERFDPANPEELREAMASGALIPPKTEEQLAALGRLETMLALIDGWVDVITAEATQRLPRSAAIAETVRRRRAAGGPAESAFATLVGLDLRPRRLREAAAMWRQVTDAVGAQKRDALWFHPDLVPTADDITDPSALIARITAGEAPLDDVDRALEDLLNDETGDRPHEDTP